MFVEMNSDIFLNFLHKKYEVWLEEFSNKSYGVFRD